MAQCGAKTRSGSRCKRQAVEGKRRCKLHGGLSTGPKDARGNRNAHKHGIYGDLIQKDEQSLVAAINSAAGTVDHELLIARLQLRRALAAQTATACQPEIDEITENEGGGILVPRSTRKSKIRNYPDIIDKLAARIGKLELIRKALDTGEADNDAVMGFETIPYADE